MTSRTRISGTKEWSVASINCVNGCCHDCRYCYARYNAVDRFHRMTREEWPVMRVRHHDVKKKQKLHRGPVMFPTTHDITPEVLEPCLAVLGKLLEVGNQVLVVSKPHFDCIGAICRKFAEYKTQILFRFTIGAYDEAILQYWEPGAPCYDERWTSLYIAYDNGFRTSVSVEPMLDSSHIEEHVVRLAPFVTDSIWIGKLNGIDSRVRVETQEDQVAVQAIKHAQSDDRIRSIYVALKGYPEIKWKESIKKVVGLRLASKAGMDE